jgi:hypothetical protein
MKPKTISSWHVGVAAEAFAAALFARFPAARMSASVGGRGATILYENHTWGPWAAAAGTTDRIPDKWIFSEGRLKKLFATCGE